MLLLALPSYSLSMLRPTRFSSSSMASSSSVKLANMLPMSLSTLTDTFGGTALTVAGAAAAAAAAEVTPAATAAAVGSGDEAVSMMPAPLAISRVGERKCSALLPALAVLFMLSLRAIVASCSELEDFSEWNECAILAMVFVDDELELELEECRCVPAA